MADITPIFGIIPEHEIDRMVDQQGFITPKGRELLKRMGVKAGSKVTIRKSKEGQY